MYQQLLNKDPSMRSETDDMIEEEADSPAKPKSPDQNKKEEIMRQVKALIPPPNPLLPKSFITTLDGPVKPGGYMKFLKLKQFFGKEVACDIGKKKEFVEKIEYHPSRVLRDVFDLRNPSENKSLVYLRSHPDE